MYLAYNPKDDLIVMAFRGTNNIRNWLSNLHFDKTDYDYCHKCKVHNGFLNAWNSLKE